MCQAGLAEFSSLQEMNTVFLPEDRQQILLHALRQQAHIEQTRMENGLSILASVGSTAPFIGLFGTVWGIMNALKAITATGSASLDVVAGPIGEALIATLSVLLRRCLLFWLITISCGRYVFQSRRWITLLQRFSY